MKHCSHSDHIFGFFYLDILRCLLVISSGEGGQGDTAPALRGLPAKGERQV